MVWSYSEHSSTKFRFRIIKHSGPGQHTQQWHFFQPLLIELNLSQRSSLADSQSNHPWSWSSDSEDSWRSVLSQPSKLNWFVVTDTSEDPSKYILVHKNIVWQSKSATTYWTISNLVVCFSWLDNCQPLSRQTLFKTFVVFSRLLVVHFITSYYSWHLSSHHFLTISVL